MNNVKLIADFLNELTVPQLRVLAEMATEKRWSMETIEDVEAKEYLRKKIL